jgi:hypothetical protein
MMGVCNCFHSDKRAEMRFLGYDVADESLLSGLMNCRYDIADMHEKSAWASELNEFHLFNDFHFASRYRCVTDMRVSEHSPFRVYSVWTIQ